MPVSITSAAGVIALLEEPEAKLKAYALSRLDGMVSNFWAEIADSVDKIELLSEDESFGQRELAALVASKVYYHLGDFTVSLEFALAAGNTFNVNESSEFVETIVSKCIDRYIGLRSATADDAAGTNSSALYEKGNTAATAAAISSSSATFALQRPDLSMAGEPIDPRLVSIVDRMFDRCFAYATYRQAIGIALEAKRIDMLERAIREGPDTLALLSYALNICLTVLQTREFRDVVLGVIANAHQSLSEPDYVSICQCYVFLENSSGAVQILRNLLSKGDDNHLLLAYQIAFDLFHSATQQFVALVANELSSNSSNSDAGGSNNNNSNNNNNNNNSSSSSSSGSSSSSNENNNDSNSSDVTGNSNSNNRNNSGEQADTADESVQQTDTSTPNGKVVAILRGEVSIPLLFEFLHRNNHTDLQILKPNIKSQQRNSVTHSAVVISHGFMQAGTGVDTFLRENMEWLARAQNWAKFSVTASLGVINMGSVGNSMNLLQSYLPGKSGSSEYAEGGSLYALGLIHAHHGRPVIRYLTDQLREARSETVKHGACLGLGIAALATQNFEAYTELRNTLMNDSAVAGEAAGLAMGLVHLGTADESVIREMVAYAQDTQHEKIVRGLALGIALTLYEKQELADAEIETLSIDKDANLRVGAMHAIALAYAGTGNNKAIRRLLHVAVSDVSDDVRRTAVTSLGFVLFRNPEQVPGVVSLLSESYNPNVRYGAALALGIACAGSGMPAALDLLEPLTNDPVDFVRQSAMIAVAMVLMQQSDAQTSKAAWARKLFEKVAAERHEDIMAKFGAIVSQGIIEAGGRNVTISLQTRTGHTNMRAAVGLLVFTHFWYWHPAIHFLSLAFTPTCIVALNKDLSMPKLHLKSNAKPSAFAYPPPLVPPKVEAKEKVSTAVLSYTAKVKGKGKKSENEALHEHKLSSSPAPSKEGTEFPMDVDSPSKKEGESTAVATDATKASSSLSSASTSSSSSTTAATPSKTSVSPMDVDTKVENDPSTTTAVVAVKAEPEPDFELLENPARVLPQQLSVISFPEDSRYKPVLKSLYNGIVLVQNMKDTEPEDLVELKAKLLGTGEATEEEPKPPAPFEYTD